MLNLSLGGEDFQFDPKDIVVSEDYLDALTARLQSFVDVSFGGPPAMNPQVLHAFYRDRLSNLSRFYIEAPRAKDFDSLPIVDKELLRNRWQDFLCIDASQQLFQKKTSGSRGRRLTFYYSESFYFEELLLSFKKIAIAAGVSVKDPFVACSLHSARHPQRFAAIDPLSPKGVYCRISVDERHPETLIEAWSVLNRVSPQIVVSKPSLWEAMLLAQKQLDLRVACRPLLAVSSGGVFPTRLREKVSGSLSCPVRDVYASTEFGIIAIECSAGALHLDESSLYAEIDPSNSELLLSSYANDALPLLRYKTGDHVVLARTVCGCGRSSQQIAFRSPPPSSDLLTQENLVMVDRSRLLKAIHQHHKCRVESITSRSNEIHITLDRPLPPRERLGIKKRLEQVIDKGRWRVELHDDVNKEARIAHTSADTFLPD